MRKRTRGEPPNFGNSSWLKQSACPNRPLELEKVEEGWARPDCDPQIIVTALNDVQVYEFLSGITKKYVYRYRDQRWAEFVLRDVLLSILEVLPKRTTPGKSFLSYFWTCVKNRCASELKKDKARSRHDQSISDDSLASRHQIQRCAAVKPDLAWLYNNEIVSRLVKNGHISEAQVGRVLPLMRLYFEGLSFKEVAERSGLSESGVCRRLKKDGPRLMRLMGHGPGGT